jgi:hypothetical protein
LPVGGEIVIKGGSRTFEMIQKYERKTWHFSFIITILAITATYFTIAELKEVQNSLD